MRLWVITALISFGFLVNVATLWRTCRKILALVRSDQNGVQWTIATGDFLDDLMKLVSQACYITVLSRALYTLSTTPQRPWTLWTWLFIVAILLLPLSSVNRWITTRILTQQLRAERSGEQ